MNAYTRQDLSVMQAWPLERKIRVTQAKIIEWYHHYGGKVAVSFRAARTAPFCWTLHGGRSPTFPPCLWTRGWNTRRYGNLSKPFPM